MDEPAQRPTILRHFEGIVYFPVHQVHQLPRRVQAARLLCHAGKQGQTADRYHVLSEFGDGPEPADL
jgi:hypothetical protein